MFRDDPWGLAIIVVAVIVATLAHWLRVRQTPGRT